ncbi:hypothetical protein D3C80_898050 [compost metagenome]
MQVVERPLIIRRIPAHELREALHPGFARAKNRGHPAILVDAATAEDFEVLRRFFRLHLSVVEGVAQADAIHWVLSDTVDLYGWRDRQHVVDRRGNVVDMVKLSANSGVGLDLFRPGNGQRRARTAEVAGDQFSAYEWP